MKDFKNDSTAVLSRFGRDKRARMVTATAERVERRPRSQRDAADSEPANHEHKPFRRASYNPHFTADNRPVFDTPRHDEGRDRASHPYGAKPRYSQDDNTSYGEKPRYSRDDSSYGEKPRRTYGGKPAYGEHKPASGRFGGAYSDRKPYDRRPGDTPSGERRAEERGYGEHKYGDRKYGEHKYGGRKPGDRPYEGRGAGDRRYGDKSFRDASGKAASPASYPKFNPEKITGAIRLNRFIAQSGICSRREADDFIRAGVVTVNGQVVTELGTKVQPTDEVRFNDQRLQGEKKVYLVLNKPKGYVTSLEDPHAGKTVMELVKGACEERIYPVGRLDKNSLGLLLFTNDGDLTKQLTHPSYKKKKIYQVTLDKPLTRADMDRIAEGITLEDGEIHADEISYVKENRQEVGIEIHSGRNRIVRRIFEFLGYTVTKLDRVYYAGLTKKNLKRGAWRFLTREEVERLKSGLYE